MSRAGKVLERFVTPFAKDQTEIHVGDIHILCSFKLPVAYYRDGDRAVSVVSTRLNPESMHHIRDWVKGRPTRTVPESELQHVMRIAIMAGVA